MKIFTPSTTLRRLYELSDRTHSMVNSPEESHIILAILPWVNGREIQEHELADKYPEKCFIISTTAHPLYKIKGVYTTTFGWTARFGNRTRTGCYTLGDSSFQNPFIRDAIPGTAIKHEKNYLASFVGRNCHPIRSALLSLKFQRKDIYVEDSSNSFALWDPQRNQASLLARQRYYSELLLKSRFALCPRGISPNSIRLFEVLKLGVAPVILADGWRPPIGPTGNDFSIFVKEKHVQEIERILSEHEHNFESMGQAASLAYENYFCEKSYFNFLVENCRDIQVKQWIPEQLARTVINASLASRDAIKRMRKTLGLRSRLKSAVKPLTQKI